jgi:DNA-binding GntR family transcriptional regulator
MGGTKKTPGGSDRVFQRLRTLIVRGELAPGTRLVETDVAAKLGVSRTPVRGAFQRLQQEGYLVGSPALRQTRPTVSPLTQDDARELFHIIAEVEGLAARYAAQLDRSPRAELAGRLTEINTKLQRAAATARPDHDLLWELDERFHRTCAEAAAGPRLRLLIDAIKPQAERYERLYVSLLGRELSRSIAEHRAIARAIGAGDPDAAQQAVQRNWRNAAERLDAVIDRIGERGREAPGG